MNNYPASVTNADDHFTDTTPPDDDPEPSPITCPFRCIDGWLPTDGITDEIRDGSWREVLLLYPTELVTCPCNPLAAINDNLVIDRDAYIVV